MKTSPPSSTAAILRGRTCRVFPETGVLLLRLSLPTMPLRAAGVTGRGALLPSDATRTEQRKQQPAAATPREKTRHGRHRPGRSHAIAQQAAVPLVPREAATSTNPTESHRRPPPMAFMAPRTGKLGVRPRPASALFRRARRPPSAIASPGWRPGEMG